MKNTAVFFVLALIVLLPINAMAGDESLEDTIAVQDIETEVDSSILPDGFNLSFGLSLWMIDEYFQEWGVIYKQKNNGPVYGPSIFMDFRGKYFFEVKYYIGRFDCSFDGENEKSDLNIRLGYRFNPYISVFSGYKDIQNKMGLGADYWYYGFYEVSFSGPVLGIGAKYSPQDSGFNFYGILEYAYLDGIIVIKDEFPDEVWTERYGINGISLELGASHVLSSFPSISLSCGLKLQFFTSAVSDEDLDSRNKGIIFGINYHF